MQIHYESVNFVWSQKYRSIAKAVHILHKSSNREQYVWWICSSRDQSSDKLIIFLDSTLDSFETWESILQTQDLILEIKTWVTVNPLVSGTISTSFKYTCENHPPLYFKNHSTSWQKSWVLRIGLTALIFFVFISSFCCTKNQSTYMKFI